MHLSTPTRRGSAAGVAAVLALGASYAGVGIAGAQNDAPAGNNGHIQIDEYVMDDDASGNDPQVACGFSVSFYGFDAGDQEATITVTPTAPTEGGTPFSVNAAWHTDERTSGNQLDHNEQISPEQLAAAVDGVEPSDKGVHLRVDVTVTGSQGANGKHKTLWMAPCDEPAAVTPEEAAHTAATDALTSGSSRDEATVRAEAAALAAGATPAEAAVLGAAAVAAVGGPVIAPAVPATAVARTASTTG